MGNQSYYPTVRCSAPMHREVARKSPLQPVGMATVNREQSAVYKCSRGGSAKLRLGGLHPHQRCQDTYAPMKMGNRRSEEETSTT